MIKGLKLRWRASGVLWTADSGSAYRVPYYENRVS
jgi:hypothetical protein